MADSLSFIDSAGTLFDDVKDVFDKYIVRPANAFGLAGFVFDVEGDATINLTADITDHYTEDNSAIQDMIAIKPKKIILKSYVGELVYRNDGTSEDLLQGAVQKLTIVNGYLPKFSAAGSQIKEFLDGNQDTISFQNVVNSAVDIYGLTKNLNPPIPRQQQAYYFFKALLEQKIIVSVDTPFEFASSMALESVTATQSENSKYISDFSVTLKEIRFASIKKIINFDRIDIKDLPAIASAQASDIAEKGRVAGKAVSSTLNTLWEKAGF